MTQDSLRKRIRPAVPVFVATTVMLSFISFWRAAAIVLSDLASSAYYVGGDTENVLGKSAPWFVLGVMLFSYAVRAVYVESCTMFVRGGVYRVVKEAMGGVLAKLSVYSLLFTSLVSFFAVMIIPDSVRSNYFGNLISGLAMYMVGPTNLKLLFQAFVVLVGVLILSGAVNTAIVGANGVLNRVSEDGVMTPWFLRPQNRYGTTYRLINLIVGLQLVTIIASRGNVYLLAALYAFGVIWSFAFKALAVLVLRFKDSAVREWKVPGNFTVRGIEIPYGLGLITILLFLIATANLFTKPDATIAGVIFSILFFTLFTVSEHLTARSRDRAHENIEQFRVYSRSELNSQMLDVRPGCILIGVRNPGNLAYLRQVLAETDTTERDVVVISARLYQRQHSFGKSAIHEAKDVFDRNEQELFTAVVTAAEKEGKPVSLLVVPGSNVFDTILLTAQRLDASVVVCGPSEKLTRDQQGKLTGDAWERLPEPKPRLTLQLIGEDGSVSVYLLGPHTPDLRSSDLEVLHSLWLDVTSDPQYAGLHHYHIVSLALERLKADMNSGSRSQILERLRNEMGGARLGAGNPSSADAVSSNRD